MCVYISLVLALRERRDGAQMRYAYRLQVTRYASPLPKGGGATVVLHIVFEVLVFVRLYL